MDDPVDPYAEIKSKCAEKKYCKDAMEKYEACTVRVTNKGFGTCEPWFFDYVKCVDHCAAPQILKILK